MNHVLRHTAIALFAALATLIGSQGAMAQDCGGCAGSGCAGGGAETVAAAVKQQMQVIYNAMDSNSDKKVTKAEMAAFLKSQGAAGQISTDDCFQAADKDKNDSLTFDEFHSYMKTKVKVVAKQEASKDAAAGKECPKGAAAGKECPRGPVAGRAAAKKADK